MGAQQSNGELIRVLGLGFGVAAAVGGMVGQGILRTPGIVAGAVPDPASIVLLWAGIGLFCLIDACATVELAAALRCAGGPYAFADRAFGRASAAVIGWADTLKIMIAIAFLAVVSAEFLQRLGLMADLPTGRLAVIIVAVLVALNWTGTRTSGASQGIGSLLKGLGLILLIGLLFAAPPPVASPGPAIPAGLSIGAFAVAARVILNTYDGWYMPAYFCEEVRAPERNVPRSVFGGIIFVTILYTVMNLALLHALTPAQMAASKLPAADAVRSLLGPTAELIVSVLSVLSVLAITNLYVMCGSRIPFAMARRGVLPAPLSRVSESGTPRRALLLVSVPAAFLTWTGNYQTLITYAVALQIVISAGVGLSAWRLRNIEPDLPRPFRMPLFPLPILASLAISSVLLAAMIYEDALHSLTGIVIVVAIGILYGLNGAFRRRIAARPA